MYGIETNILRFDKKSPCTYFTLFALILKDIRYEKTRLISYSLGLGIKSKGAPIFEREPETCGIKSANVILGRIFMQR